MKNIWNKIQPDKKKHLIAGIAIMIAATTILLIIGKTFTIALEQAVAIVCVVAVAKEVYDFVLYQLGKKPNWNPLGDIAFTVAIPIVIQIINLLLR